MPKKPTKTAKQPSSPTFNYDCVFPQRCLAVDSKGVAWWVDPDARQIIRATEHKPKGKR